MARAALCLRAARGQLLAACRHVSLPHLRSAASALRGMRALGLLSTAHAGAGAASDSCPASSSAAAACEAASAPADTRCSRLELQFWLLLLLLHGC